MGKFQDINQGIASTQKGARNKNTVSDCCVSDLHAVLCALCFALCAINSSQERNGMVGTVVSNDVLLLVFGKNQSRVYHQYCFILLVYLSLFFCAILLAEQNPLCQKIKTHTNFPICHIFSATSLQCERSCGIHLSNQAVVFRGRDIKCVYSSLQGRRFLMYLILLVKLNRSPCAIQQYYCISAHYHHR